jgi:beta-lactamase class C
MIGFLPKYRIGVVTMWNSSGPTPAGLMPMVFDELLGLPHVDWAGIESSAPKTSATTAKGKTRSRGRTAASGRSTKHDLSGN